MTVTMDNAAKTLREVAVTVLSEANQRTNLCLSDRDIESAATMVSEDRQLQMIAALGGMGDKLHKALTVWFDGYCRKRMAWLYNTPAGRVVMQERAPAALRALKIEKHGVRRRHLKPRNEHV